MEFSDKIKEIIIWFRKYYPDYNKKYSNFRKDFMDKIYVVNPESVNYEITHQIFVDTLVLMFNSIKDIYPKEFVRFETFKNKYEKKYENVSDNYINFSCISLEFRIKILNFIIV